MADRAAELERALVDAQNVIKDREEAFADLQNLCKDQVSTLQLTATFCVSANQTSRPACCPDCAAVCTSTSWKPGAGRADSSLRGKAGSGTPRQRGDRVGAGCCYQGAYLSLAVLLCPFLPGTGLPCMPRQPPMCFWPPQVGPTAAPQEIYNHKAFLDEWVLKSGKVDPRVTTRLSGEDSPYQACSDACHGNGNAPISVQSFINRFEELLEFRLGLPSTKSRDGKGVYFPCVKLS